MRIINPVPMLRQSTLARYIGVFSPPDVLFKSAHSGFAHEGAAICVTAQINLGGFDLNIVSEIPHLDGDGRAVLMKRHSGVRYFGAVQCEIRVEHVRAEGRVLGEAEPPCLVPGQSGNNPH